METDDVIEGLCSSIRQYGQVSWKLDDIITTGDVQKVVASSLPEVMDHYLDVISKASREICIATAYYDRTSRAAQMFVDQLKSLDRSLYHQADVMILLDCGSIRHLMSNRVSIHPSRLWIPTFKNLSVRVVSYHDVPLGTMHAKFMVVDRRVAIISSNNIQDRPNLELSVELHGNVASKIHNLFKQLWQHSKASIEIPSLAVDAGTDYKTVILAYRKAFGGFFERFASPQNVAWQWIIQHARANVFVQTPNLNARVLIRLLIEACKRGVVVTLYLTLGFNDRKENLPFQGGTNLDNVKRIFRDLGSEHRHNLHVHWYTAKGAPGPQRGVHSHVKFMSADDNVAMLGNANFDNLSVYHSMEVNLVCFGRETVSRLKESLVSAQDTHLYAFPNNRLRKGPPIAR